MKHESLHLKLATRIFYLEERFNKSVNKLRKVFDEEVEQFRKELDKLQKEFDDEGIKLDKEDKKGGKS